MLEGIAMLLWQLIAPESNDIAFHIQHGMTKAHAMFLSHLTKTTWPNPSNHFDKLCSNHMLTCIHRLSLQHNFALCKSMKALHILF